MSEYNYKEVYFSEYCSRCLNEKKEEHEEPCCDCLEEPMQEYSHKPSRFIERSKK